MHFLFIQFNKWLIRGFLIGHWVFHATSSCTFSTFVTYWPQATVFIGIFLPKVVHNCEGKGICPVFKNIPTVLQCHHYASLKAPIMFLEIHEGLAFYIGFWSKSWKKVVNTFARDCSLVAEKWLTMLLISQIYYPSCFSPHRLCHPMTSVASCWGPRLFWCGWESFATSRFSKSTM